MAEGDKSGQVATNGVQGDIEGLHVGRVDGTFFGPPGDVYHACKACRALEEWEEELGHAKAGVES